MKDFREKIIELCAEKSKVLEQKALKTRDAVLGNIVAFSDLTTPHG